jgi:superfamily II DNA/RNA helicase
MRQFARFITGLSNIRPGFNKFMNSYPALTEIQRLAMPCIWEGKNTIMTAETGTGKTLSYLVPLMAKIDTKKKSADGQLIILTVSKHLQLQIAQTIQSINDYLDEEEKISYSIIPRPVGIPKSLLSSTHIHLSSPKLLMETFSKPKELSAYLSNARFICFDEADQLIAQYGEDFLPLVRQALRRNKTFSETQFVFSAATLPVVKELKSKTPRAVIQRFIPDLETISTQGVHSTHEGLVETFLSGIPDDFTSKFHQLLSSIIQLKEKRQIIVFVSSPEKAETLHQALEKCIPALKDEGVDTILDLIHGKMEKQLRTEKILELATKIPKIDSLNILICTDVASRGIDFRYAEAIINFDFPKEASEYLHRVGRVCRGDVKHGTGMYFYS